MVLATPASDGNDYMPSLPEGIRLRLMKASDVSVVRALHASLLPVQYPHAFFVQLLLHSRYLCVVATHEDAVVAFASAAIDAPKERVEHGVWLPAAGYWPSAGALGRATVACILVWDVRVGISTDEGDSSAS
ncbi:hypothetical protein ID866_5036 [Astraeus odoratus]|nr:hypothetical protein ID866_5036 [Astraeus odoratus]